MISPRARNAARLLGAVRLSCALFAGQPNSRPPVQSNESAQDFHDSDFAAPLHSLGGSGSQSSSSTSSARSSVEIPTGHPLGRYDSEQHPLHRATGYSKAQQHAQGRVEGLEEKLFDADLELMEREVERNLDGAIAAHREAEDWDLLGGDEEAASPDNRKKLM